MRKIEMGWMNYDEGEETFKQVRTRKGGGTRKVHVSKDSQKSDLIQEAIQLFFGDGKNTLGEITDFEVDLKNYKDLSVDEHTTVGKLYAETKLPILRFYLTTKKKKHSVSDVEEDLAVTGQELDISSPTEEGTGDPDVVYIGSNAESEVSFLYSREQTSSNLEVNILEDSNIVTLFTEDIINFGDQSLDDTLPLSPVNNTHPEKTKRILVVHRGHVLPELIAHFSDESVLEKDIKIQHIAPDGKLERGHDEGGVVRDCLAEFWNEFYDQCTLGSSFKVPFLRHDFGQQHWESVGRIIVFGWQKEKYLPVKIAPVIMEQVASGCVKSNIIENFLKYVSEPERIVFQAWQSDFNSVDKEELLEVLDVHSCRKMPTENNAEEVLQELAHKKLIQEPAYVMEQWANIFSNAVIRIEDISSMYENLQPTVRKVVRSVSFPENMNAQQKEIQRYLTNYLRESSTQGLCRFLRFCTGSDLLVGKTITVNFTEVQGFQRRPISHTCGCVLELSVCYDSYPDFRSEMNKIMESNVWVMDII
ncbi:hypothetical protein E1301_Tti023617 [Triplophysa tibetana]|uniref:HECT domain-containing protein n=1 Tax=Triplophysa tibetana TaxID=1572043 RepID=A0A5A9PIA0_9TELE|nr:hypothetical protein E1301_Tti023710 [Triplophysa tibetana]KAA0715546.1 hypothetical protein E1301_Tti010076 [Triplophysa tibetana]KAA0719390.1 hypothetical protein E1301_Tti022475 [Triplophysa tibetana]KAA0721623.1 hypothetical protein E1301_Tti023617 [Triplophysa tibetana]